MAWVNYPILPVLTGANSGTWKVATSNTNYNSHPAWGEFTEATSYAILPNSDTVPTGKLWGDDNNCIYRNSGEGITLKYNGVDIGGIYYSLSWNTRFTLYCGINEETQEGDIFGVMWYTNANSCTYLIYHANNTDWYKRCYTILKAQTPPPTYTWQSVPSISGKNGILSLPVLIDTDGNPVSNGSINDFSTFPAGAKVRTLADANVN